MKNFKFSDIVRLKHDKLSLDSQQLIAIKMFTKKQKQTEQIKAQYILNIYINVNIDTNPYAPPVV